MADRMPEAIFRSAEAADLQAIEKWLKDERERADEGFYCNWNIIAQAFKDRRLFVVDAGSGPVAFLANEPNHHLIAEVRPDCRGKGYGRVIADAMINPVDLVGPKRRRDRLRPGGVGTILDPDGVHPCPVPPRIRRWHLRLP